jgi:uncharacterized LabA/DUF88 family protein
MNFNDVAIFLDLDNVVIGATEVNLTFDINLILDHIKTLTGGRIVLRRAYGDWQQHQSVIKELATAGFELQSIVRLSHMSKNLADMQMVVDAIETLIDGHQFTTYVLITGDRDFVPLVQALRKRSKQVIGIGLKHTSSKGLVNLCDQYIYYEQLAPPSHRLLERDVEKLLRQALDQLLKDKSRVPASLLKQHLQALSHGGFTRSKQGRKSFRTLLSQYPALVRVEQEGTTLYVSRPSNGAAPRPSSVTATPDVSSATRPPLSPEAMEALLQRALEMVPAGGTRIRASLLKQWLVELSDGGFSDDQQGSKTFRQFLTQYPHLLQIENEGSTLYVAPVAAKVGRETAALAPTAAGQPLPESEVADLLERVLAELLTDQPRPRASLVKQRLQELSQGAFDESVQGYASFRHFLEQYPHLIALQQTGSTLFVTRPQQSTPQAELHLHYRAYLKKQGLRVVPSEIRLQVLKDIIVLLKEKGQVEWQEIVTRLATYYQTRTGIPISKSFINDVLRVAQRADVISIADNMPWSSAPVRLRLTGDRIFQNAVMRCDAAYLDCLQSSPVPFDLETAALALYDAPAQVRYLQVVLHQGSRNGRVAGR